MKILEIIPQLSSGGAERFVVDLCNELSKNNEVTLAVFYNLDEYGFYSNELLESVRLISLNKQLGFSPLFFNKIYRIIGELRPDIVHIHLSAITYVCPSVFLYRKAKYYMTIHNDAEKEADGRLGILIRRFFFRNNKITPVTISVQSLNSFVKCYGVQAPMIFNGRKINVKSAVPNEVIEEFKQFKTTPLTRVIVNVARMNTVKRQPLIAKVVKRLYEEGEDFSLLMIGHHRESMILNEVNYIKSSNLFILGERPNPLDFLRLADAFCLASLYEGMPISLIEALGVGAVPICTPVGGIVDVIKDGENGFLASDLSEESVYNAFKRFLHTSPEEMQNIIDNVIKSYAPFTMSECASRYLELFTGKAI